MPIQAIEPRRLYRQIADGTWQPRFQGFTERRRAVLYRLAIDVAGDGVQALHERPGQPTRNHYGVHGHRWYALAELSYKRKG